MIHMYIAIAFLYDHMYNLRILSQDLRIISEKIEQSPNQGLGQSHGKQTTHINSTDNS